MSDDQSKQRERFIDAARKAECDEDEAAFRAKLAVIARQKPKDETEKTAQEVRDAKKHDV